MHLNLKFTVKKYLSFFNSVIFHFLAVGVIIYLTLPVAQWYLDKIPARGIDLYNSATYVAYLSRHFTSFFSGWKYIWYEGSPFGADYPFLHFYLMVPFAKFLGLIRGIQIFALTSNFLLLIFSYFLFFALSKNRVLSVILAVLVAYTLNLYRALVWAGGIPYFSTQMFLPLCLFLIVKYLHTRNKGWFFSLILVSGLGMLGHPQPFITTIFPLVFLLILFWVRETEKFFQWQKIRDIVILGLLSLLVALPVIHSLISVGIDTIFAYLRAIFGRLPLGTGVGGPGSLAKSQGSYGAGSVLEEASPAITEWARQQFLLVFKDTNLLLWLLLGLSALLFLFSLLVVKNRLRRIFSLLPFILGLAYVVFYVYLLSIGLNLYHGGWYKVFWPIPIVVGLLASALWGKTDLSFGDLSVFRKPVGKFLRWAGFLMVNSLLFLGAYYAFLRYSPPQEIVRRINHASILSSAFPESLNVKINKEAEDFKKELLPSFLDPSSKDFRLYVIDATVNIWWNALFDLPLARGYIDPPHYGEAGSLFWLNSALSPSAKGKLSSLADDWKVPEEIAENNTRFLLDWFAIKYFEGNHSSQTNSALAPPVTSEELVKTTEVVKVPGAVKRYVQEWGEEEWFPEAKTELKYYEVKDDIVSPIFLATNASVVAIIGDESAYDTISRLFAQLNLNSQKLIFVRGPKFIEGWSLSDLSSFDALILYGYDYRRQDKAWGLIEKYLKRGGKVLVETGGEVKESDSIHLPERFPKELPTFFPIRRTIREDLGRDWNLEALFSQAEDINFEKFSPLDIDGEVWNISHPPSLEDVDEEAKIILKNKGYPVMAAKEVGEGKIVWSGLNLPYHILRNQNQEEAEFLAMILADLVNLIPPPPITSKIDWISAEKRRMVGEGAKGVLLKEQQFPGWSAVFRGGKGTKPLKIYSAGPTLPGFMYIRLPEDKDFEVTFKFSGDPKIRLYTGISFLVILFLLDYLLLRKKVLGGGVRYVLGLLKKRLGRWWEKEEVY